MLDTVETVTDLHDSYGVVGDSNHSQSAHSTHGTTVSPGLIYIAATGRSGSTMLDLLLGGSPFVQGTGEIEQLAYGLRSRIEPCTCGRPVASCPFWLSIQRKGAEQLGLSSEANLFESRSLRLDPSVVSPLAAQVQRLLLLLGQPAAYRAFSRIFAKRHHDAVENSLFWYDVIRRATGKPIIVDSSKNAQRMKALYMADPACFKLIFLVRDGRGVTASEMRRKGVSMTQAARYWVGIQRLLLRAQASIPAACKVRIHYEELCQAPGPTLQTICRFVGIPYDERFVQIRRNEAHNICGNPMRHRTTETQIVLDEQWKEQLTSADLAVFQRIAGAVNERLGYTA